MSLLKNIKKELLLKPTYSILSKHYQYLASKQVLESIDFGETRVMVNHIDMDEVIFKVTSIKNIDNVVDELTEILIDRLVRDSNKFKTLATKVLKAWEETPELFKKQTGSSKETYLRTGLFNSDEYMTSVFLSFDKISYHSDYSFATGYGGNTYYPKKYYSESLSSIDAWVNKISKEVRSAKVKARIKNALLKLSFSINTSKAEDIISDNIIEKIDKKSNSKKIEFPLKLSANDMNMLLDEFEGFVDEDEVELFKEEFEIDLSPILNWEISKDTDGYHNHDGQVCDYTATFTSPEGFEYYIHDSHSLVTGWNLSDEVEVTCEI